MKKTAYAPNPRNATGIAKISEYRLLFTTSQLMKLLILQKLDPTGL